MGYSSPMHRYFVEATIFNGVFSLLYFGLFVWYGKALGIWQRRTVLNNPWRRTAGTTTTTQHLVPVLCFWAIGLGFINTLMTEFADWLNVEEIYGTFTFRKVLWFVGWTSLTSFDTLYLIVLTVIATSSVVVASSPTTTTGMTGGGVSLWSYFPPRSDRSGVLVWLILGWVGMALLHLVLLVFNLFSLIRLVDKLDSLLPAILLPCLLVNFTMEIHANHHNPELVQKLTILRFLLGFDTISYLIILPLGWVSTAPLSMYQFAFLLDSISTLMVLVCVAVQWLPSGGAAATAGTGNYWNMDSPLMELGDDEPPATVPTITTTTRTTNMNVSLGGTPEELGAGVGYRPVMLQEQPQQQV